MISLALLAALTFDAAAIAQTTATLNALGPHPFGSPRNQAAAQFVAAKLKEAGLSQTTTDEFVFEGSPGTNVIASLPGRTDRLLILATHHDSRKDAPDVSDRSRSLSLLIEIGRQAASLRPARTWILVSFDGGESRGEGLAHYLSGLGKSLGLVDGILLLDAAPLRNPQGDPSLIAPACPDGKGSTKRGLATRELVRSAISGTPAFLDFSFDDPAINLLTQTFIRAFRTECDPLSATAIANGAGVIVVKDTSYSRDFLAPSTGAAPSDPALRDDGAMRLGQVAFAALQGMDAQDAFPGSDSWLVVGRAVFPGWLVFLLGLATLIPGLVAVRSDRVRLGARAVHSALFTVILYLQPEVALFAGAFPNLVPPQAPRSVLTLALAPFFLLLCAGALGFARGRVNGTWLSVWEWLALGLSAAILYASPRGGRKASAARTKRSKR